MAYTTLFAFGDSLSDAGNDWIVDGHTDPVAPYYQGHFSNGLTWVEDLSKMPTRLAISSTGRRSADSRMICAR